MSSLWTSTIKENWLNKSFEKDKGNLQHYFGNMYLLKILEKTKENKI